MAGRHLLTAASNGNGTAEKMVEHGFGNINKRFSYTIHVYGSDFDGSTVTLEGSHDNITFTAITDASWTAAALTNIEFYGTYLRGVVASGSGSESIDMVLV